MEMARKRGARASILLRVTMILLLIVFVFVPEPHFASADDHRSMAILRGRDNHKSDKKFYTTPTFRKGRGVADESEDPDAAHEPHPADELLQSQDADGSQSYILGGY